MLSALFARPHQAPVPARMTLVDETSPDEVLVRRIADGDRLAMQTLFARHRTRIYRWLLRLVKDGIVAEELLSNVFLDVWRHAARFDARSSVSTWLMAIARFRALSARRRQTVVQLMTEINAHPGDDDQKVPAERNSRGELLRRAMMKLSPQHREVIDLAYYHEKSVDDVAQILQVPSAAVKICMFEARKRLAKLVS